MPEPTTTPTLPGDGRPASGHVPASRRPDGVTESLLVRVPPGLIDVHVVEVPPEHAVEAWMGAEACPAGVITTRLAAAETATAETATAETASDEITTASTADEGAHR